MPFDPSPEDIKSYGLRQFIEEKAKLVWTCEMELEILRADPKGSEKARDELERTKICFEGCLPPDPGDAAKFLEKCRNILAKDAKSLIEYVRAHFHPPFMSSESHPLSDPLGGT